MSRVKHHRACTRYAQPLSNVQIPAIPSCRITQPLYFLQIQNWLVSAHSTATSTRVVSTHTLRCGLNLLKSADTKIGGWGDIPPYRQMCGSPSASSSSSDSCQLLTASLTPFVLMFARPSFANSFGMHVYVMTPGGVPPAFQVTGKHPMTLLRSNRKSAGFPFLRLSALSLLPAGGALLVRVFCVRARSRGDSFARRSASGPVPCSPPGHTLLRKMRAALRRSYTPHVSRI